MRTKLHTMFAPILCLAMASSAIAEERQKRGDLGVLCLTALIAAQVEVGRLCLPEYNPEGQGVLRHALSRLENHILQHPDWDQSKIDTFRAQVTGVGKESPASCEVLEPDVDTLGWAKFYIDFDAHELNALVDKTTSRPVTPAWGNC